MIKMISDVAKQHTTGGDDYGMNHTEFAVGDNVTFKDNAAFIKYDGTVLGRAAFLSGPNVTCTIAQLGNTSKSELRRDNNHLRLSACYDNGEKISDDILSWLPENEVNKI